MGSFKGLPSELIGGKYEGGVMVILESEEDVRILSDHWFAGYQDKIRFKSAEDGTRGGGGCKAVIRKVKHARDLQLPAFGIVDRDTLLSNGKSDIFWEADDLAFHGAKPYGDEIHVLRRWELENYLLKPEAFSAEAACRVSRGPSPQISADDFLSIENDVVDITAFSSFMLSHGKPSHHKFAQRDSGERLRGQIDEHMKSALSSSQGYSDLAQDIEKIKAFSEDEQVSGKRWDRLNRILDGKKTLNRICGILSVKHDIKGLTEVEEMRGCLANRIATKNLIDDELTDLIERLSKSN